MKENLEATHGLIFSQRVLISLVEAGLSRDDAYRLVQDKAMAVWDSGEDFKNMLLKDHAITKYLSFGEINDCFDYNHYLRHTDRIFNRLKLIPD
ncbi:MAG: adenylosuccinate lyase, partial [Terriglobia bacterium]